MTSRHIQNRQVDGMEDIVAILAEQARKYPTLTKSGVIVNSFGVY
jgi:hypothetical protein